MAIRLACANVRVADIEYLEGCLVRRSEAAKKDGAATVDQFDIDFHQRIIDLSRNKVIRDLVRDNHLYDRIFRIPCRVPSYWQADEELDAMARHSGYLNPCVCYRFNAP